ncbi:hypothetical protein K488DRAFT_86502 [Vararia minispora EC-137]|uniref:Uncharacterized protein n=1 Tax=Vararia minispora EC-137 TaxID=1314806 RepID=A0ACB8QJG0_9AGAM|nr:hypothetical protein K488DRAFT_86502 [Vararia minispora EC-137]
MDRTPALLLVARGRRKAFATVVAPLSPGDGRIRTASAGSYDALTRHPLPRQWPARPSALAPFFFGLRCAPALDALASRLSPLASCLFPHV